MDLNQSTQGKRYLFFITQNYSYAILRPLQSEILLRGGEVAWFLMGEQVSAHYLRANETQLKQVSQVKAWQPDACFAPGNVLPNFFPGKKIALFHGFNVTKRVQKNGLSTHFKIRGCFDLYCTQGPNTTKTFQQLANEHGYFKVQETGWSAMDPLFKPSKDNPYLAEQDPRPTLLVCSTFSHRLSLAPRLYQQIKDYSQSGKWRILVQFHPKMAKEIVSQYQELQNDNLTFVETDNVIPLLQAADVMLCDTSSVLLMFLLQRKPVVTFRNQDPQPHLLNITKADKVEAAIEQALTRPAELMKKIEDYCQELHPYQDGLSSQRVLAATNQLIGADNTELKSKPLNLMRELKIRKKLGYWGW
ncbi:CDP-glycerol glycerophosphotransferase family protein [Kangiella sp. TOML190]|uniref:CDP-glycerol glycerophosphotransferase family protein n=1 Tax=Kangiella sp. TOML190 TaxID=2931351 RepID=UPI00203AE295|nr:CDP-glycerol glycerophosphotransferase family protein [Kangiella sp. TOML190]